MDNIHVTTKLLGVQRYFTKRYDTYRDTCATIRYVSRYFSHRGILFGNNQIEISVSYFVKGINSSFNDVLCSKDEDKDAMQEANGIIIDRANYVIYC